MPATKGSGSSATLWATLALAAAFPLSGCLLVGGYRSGGGFFFWPGSVGLFLVAFLLFVLLRRRR